MRSIVAILLANLPTRWWGPFEERFPLYRYAWVSGIATMLAGFAIGIPGFLEFLQDAASGFNTVLRDQQDVEYLSRLSRGWAVGSLAVYLFATPQGLLSLYLALTGLVRFAAAFITDEPHGDWILTRLDDLGRKIWRDTDDWDKRKSREKLEGREMPDRLVTGEWLGRQDIELAILASRRKEWPRGAYLVNAEGTAYQIGDSFDVTTKAGLRAVYPLTELKTGEAIRHAFDYELPPLWRGIERDTPHLSQENSDR